MMWDMVRRLGLETAARRFYADYRAVVVSARDPKGQGRVQALVAGAAQEEATPTWVYPSFMGAGANRGWFWPPEEGDSVMVSFKDGDPDRPEVFYGGWYGENERPTEFAPGSGGAAYRRGCVTRGGHALLFDDTPDAEVVSLRWHQTAPGDSFRTQRRTSGDRSRGKTSSLEFTASGVVVRSHDGSTLTFNATSGVVEVKHAGGAKVTLTSQGVTVEAPQAVTLKAPRVVLDAPQVAAGSGASHPSVRGDVLLQWALTHTHPPTGGPAIQPLPPSVLSPGVKIP